MIIFQRKPRCSAIGVMTISEIIKRIDTTMNGPIELIRDLVITKVDPHIMADTIRARMPGSLSLCFIKDRSIMESILNGNQPGMTGQVISVGLCHFAGNDGVRALAQILPGMLRSRARSSHRNLIVLCRLFQQRVDQPQTIRAAIQRENRFVAGSRQVKHCFGRNIRKIGADQIKSWLYTA